MEAKILLQSQNAFDLAFPPLEILVGNAEGKKWKREVETGENVYFPNPEILLWEAEGERGKV